MQEHVSLQNFLKKHSEDIFSGYLSVLAIPTGDSIVPNNRKHMSPVRQLFVQNNV